MDTKSEIIDLEKRFWQTMIDRDVDTAVGMMADHCIVTSAQGVANIDKATFAKMMRGGKWDLHAFWLEDVQVSSPAPDIAVIGYKVKEKLTVDGQKLTMEAADASTWVRHDGKWLCTLHTESVLGDPFGRDRKPS